MSKFITTARWMISWLDSKWRKVKRLVMLSRCPALAHNSCEVLLTVRTARHKARAVQDGISRNAQ